MSTLVLDAEALYGELLVGVRAMAHPAIRLVGIASAAPGWPSACTGT